MTEKEDIFSNLKEAVNRIDTVPEKMTVLPLRDIVIYPHMIFPILIGRTSSLKSVAEAVERDKYLFVSAQKDPNVDDPGFKDIYVHGTITKIIQIVRLPNNLLKVLVEGLFQGKIIEKLNTKEYLEAKIKMLGPKPVKEDTELEALIRHAGDLFAEYIRENHNIPTDIIGAFENIDDPVRKLFFAAANIDQKVPPKQKLLSETNLKKQFFELSSLLSSEIELLKLEDEIGEKVQDSIQKTQRKFFIQEQIRALQKELGDEEEASPELAALKEMLEKAEMPKEAREKANEEFERLKKTPTMSPEFSVNRNYLELLAQLPWKNRTEDNFDIEHVKKILDEDHYDLEKPKDRILEFIAVLNMAGSLKRQILCFVGPPGVGKTSLGRSIARALGRKFVRFSLGGVRDEAEIRGHRRTYIGAMPGKIIQSMKKAGTVNPVILLDEVDKMSMDFRGDPSSALLEVLDPEQNNSFNDHYIDVDYDLSNVLFITTANVRYDIPLPLQDRMEIIELSSYLEPEKIEIAKRHILPRLLKEYGLEDMNIRFEDKALSKLIREYTREAGARNLEREIASVLRKIAKEIVHGYDKRRSRRTKTARTKALRLNPYFKRSVNKKKFTVDNNKIEEYLKAPRFKDKKEETEDKIGVATGLAWTSVGGDTMQIEATIMPGTEKLTLTGKLGDVMKESAMAGLSFIRAKAKDLGVPVNFNKKKEIHIHVPEGAIPKDGPSAGISMAMALISAASGRAVRGNVAMTGEITLRGNILPVGGLKEKLLAAKRAGIKTVLIPKENERDIEDIKDVIKKGLKIVPVSHITDALDTALKK